MWSLERSILWAGALGDPPSVANTTYRIIHTPLTATIHYRRHTPAYITSKTNRISKRFAKLRSRHFWRWLLETPLTVLSFPCSPAIAISNHLLLIPFALRRHSAHHDPPAHINKLKQQNQRTLFKIEGPPFLEIAPPNTTQYSVFSTLTTCRCKQPAPALSF